MFHGVEIETEGTAVLPSHPVSELLLIDYGFLPLAVNRLPDYSLEPDGIMRITKTALKVFPNDVLKRYFLAEVVAARFAVNGRPDLIAAEVPKHFLDGKVPRELRSSLDDLEVVRNRLWVLNKEVKGLKVRHWPDAYLEDVVKVDAQDIWGNGLARAIGVIESSV